MLQETHFILQCIYIIAKNKDEEEDYGADEYETIISTLTCAVDLNCYSKF